MLYSNAQSKNQSQSEILAGLKLLCEPGELYDALSQDRPRWHGQRLLRRPDKAGVPCRLLVRNRTLPSTHPKPGQT